MNKKKLKKAQVIWRALARSRKAKNILFTVFAIIFFGGYAFFFLSPYIFNGGINEEVYSDPRETFTLANREVNILQWVWCPEQGDMEVILNIQEQSYAGNEELSVEAVERSEEDLLTEIICQEPNLIVIHIKDVNKKFAAISLRLKINDSVLKLYTNRLDVDQTEKITAKSEEYYHNYRLNRMISVQEQEIEALQDQIQAKKDEITTATEYIDKMEKEKEYQASTELKNTETLIREAEQAISSANDAILRLEEEISDKQSNIDATKAKMLEE